MRTVIRTTLLTFALCLPLACSDQDPDLSSGTLGASTDEAGSTSSEPAPEDTTANGTTSGTTDADAEPTDGDEPAPDVPVCNPEDDLEPNNTELEATVLPNITDDDAAGSLIESILAGENDVDWFAYTGTDVAFAYVDPTSKLVTDTELRLCLFVECVSGTTPPPDCINSIYDESPEEGFVGCCNTGESAFVSIDLTCPGGDGDDNAYVFMRIDRGEGDECVPYDLEYHF